jgi:TonB family protein
METLIYLAKANLYLVLFYCTYWLLLRRHTFFQWNRIYLLGTIAASFLLPAIVFYNESGVPVAASTVTEFATTAVNASPVPEETSSWPILLLLCYSSGVLVMLFKLLSSLRQIFILIKNGECIPLEEYTLIFLDPGQFKNKDCGSFSFFRWMIVNREDYANNPDTILRHEHVHIRQWHSADILLIELLKVVFWINPVLWFYKRSMQAVHEYLADTEAANRDSYAHFLVSYALKVPEQLLTNHFSNSSLLKDRIKMIYKNRTSNWLLSKYLLILLLILPLIIVTVFLTAARKYIPQPAAIETNALSNMSLIRGTVSDLKGKRIPGANVVVKNTFQGAATDREGNFELKNVGDNAVIVVSHIQFKSKEIAVKKGKVSYDVVIEPDNTVLKNPTITPESSPAKPAPAKPVVKEEATGKSTFKVAEQKPEFPGGYGAMLEYLRSNTKYPTPALKANVEGVVIVRFTVDKEGAINSVVIVKGVGFGLDAESIRLVKNMPKWKPGIQNGEPIAMAQTVEIKFDLASAKGDKRQGFHLPKMDGVTKVFQVAAVEVDDIFSSSLAFFEPKTFKPSINPPKAEYKYVADSSSYRFMNYNSGLANNYMGLQTTGRYKYLKELEEKRN